MPIPADLHLASHLFQANCGPASFAALVGTLVTDIIRFFPHFPNSPHTTIPQMQAALDQCGINYQNHQFWPKFGLCLIQFKGKWSQNGRFYETAKHRHWVSCCDSRIYDVNANKWLSKQQWLTNIMPQLMEAHPGSQDWCVAKAYEVEPQECLLPMFPPYYPQPWNFS